MQGDACICIKVQYQTWAWTYEINSTIHTTKFITGKTSKWSGNEVGIEMLIAYRQEQIFHIIQIYRYMERAFTCSNSYKGKGPLKLTEDRIRRLEEIGFKWILPPAIDTTNISFDQRIEELKEFED